MKDYLEKRREELRKEQGFTLMEMLIVVAIIAVLIAIAIPVFSNQLEKSREAADLANIRAAYAEAMTEFAAGPSTVVSKKTEKMTQANSGWDQISIPNYLNSPNTLYAPVAGDTVEVTINSDGTVSTAKAAV